MNKGFTWIELLEVIAIIGVLSSIVIAGLYTERNKAHRIEKENTCDEYCQKFGR